MTPLGSASPEAPGTPAGGSAFRLYSPAFADGGFMPAECSSGRLGRNSSPALAWENPPSGTAALALLAEDLDVPRFLRIAHWILYNIPSEQCRLEPGRPSGARLPDGSAQGLNFFRRNGYLGPNPIPARSVHRYRFDLMALDEPIVEDSRMDLRRFMRAVSGHILAEATFTGLFGGSAARADPRPAAAP
jgi:Raf kinase inhibitor-like YbhB/YbcL family protein